MIYKPVGEDQRAKILLGMVSGLCLRYEGLERKQVLIENNCYWNSSVSFLLSTVPFLNITTDILLGTHWESGAVTFWSHALNLPLASNAILSWKFCHMVHKLIRDGHPNVSPFNSFNS